MERPGARVNYEGAWTRLQAYIATEKSGYGRQELLGKMAEIAGEYLHDDNRPETAAAVPGAVPPVQAVAPPATDEPKEVHDGSSNRPQAAVA